MPAVLHPSKMIVLNEGMKVMLKMDRKKVTDEIWLILGKYAPNDKNRFEIFSEWIDDDAEKVENFVKLMVYNELKVTDWAWDKIYELFTEFDNLVWDIDTNIVVSDIFNNFQHNQFTATLNYNNFDEADHKDILRCYCSYLGMKKWKDTTEALLKKRSQYVYSYLKLYPKIESENSEFADWKEHWVDLQVTYSEQIWPVLQNNLG